MHKGRFNKQIFNTVIRTKPAYTTETSPPRQAEAAVTVA